MNTRPTIVSILQFRKLLHDICDHNHGVCVRFRLLGELWKPYYVRVIRVTENGAIFNEEKENRYINVPDLSLIMQFEVDARIYEFQPHFHYDVAPLQKDQI